MTLPPLLGVLSASLALLLASCSEPARTRADIDRSPFAGRTPREGTIALHSPQPAGKTTRKVRARPTVIVITTDRQRGRTVDQPVGMAAGTIRGDAPDNRPTEKGVARRIFDEARADTVFPVSPERFQELWGALEEIGVFELPRFRGGIPREDRPTIRLSAEGRTWIFLRPSEAAAADLPADQEGRDRVAEIWANVKAYISFAATQS